MRNKIEFEIVVGLVMCASMQAPWTSPLPWAYTRLLQLVVESWTKGLLAWL